MEVQEAPWELLDGASVPLRSSLDAVGVKKKKSRVKVRYQNISLLNSLDML